MGHRTRHWLWFALIACSGCAASHQYFEPTERVRGTTFQGYPEAVYDLVGAHSHFGEAKLWSRGAYRGPDGSTVVQVSLEIHNTSAQPIVVASANVRLRPVHTDDGTFDDVEAAERETYTIPPSSIRELRFHFVFPHHVSPGDVYGFRAQWHVTNADQSYGQFTPFVEEYRRGRYAHMGLSYYYCDPFDPFCYGYYPYGYPYYGPIYGPVIVGGPMRGDRVMVRPR